jgi:branched-chain amino acid transport system substrate-binding protein
MIRSIARRRLVVVLVAASAALLLASCGSRVSQQAIVAAARGTLSRTVPGDSGSTQALGTTGTTIAGASSASGGSGTSGAASNTGSSSVGATGGSAAATSGGGAAATQGSGSAAKAGAASGSAVNIGNVGSYSGVIGAIFAGAQQSLEVWEAYVNAHGGLNGHPVHLYSEDDGGDPSTSQTDVEQEVTQDHVIAFVGNMVPLTVSASVSYLQQQNIPVIGGDASSLEWWQSPVLFPEGSYLEHEGDQLIKLAVAQGKTKLGYLYCIEDTTCTNGYQEEIVQGAAKADGADPVYTASYSLTQPDFTSECLAAQQAGANVVFFAGDGDSLVRMANDCSAQNYKPLYLAASIAVNAAVQSDPLLDGLYSVQSDFPWTDSYTPAQATYQQAMKQYAPGLAGSGSSAAEWTSGMLAVAADQYLGATPTSAEFFKGLWSLKNDTLGGLAPPLTFTPDADATQSNCYFEMILQSGQFVDPNHGGDECYS